VPWDDALNNLLGIVLTWFVLSLAIPWQRERAINIHFSGSESITGSETEEKPVVIKWWRFDSVDC
jgi:hypothetical protein